MTLAPPSPGTDRSGPNTAFSPPPAVPTHRRHRRWFEANPGCLPQLGMLATVAALTAALGWRRGHVPRRQDR